MSQPPLDPATERALERLRANAARAGIALAEDDLARIAAGAYLRNVELFDRLVARVAPDTLPDYLKDWNPPFTPPAARHQPGEQR